MYIIRTYRTGSVTRCILISLIDILGCTTGIRKVFSCFSWRLPNQSWKWFSHHFLQRSHKIDYFRSCNPVPFYWRCDAFWIKHPISFVLVTGLTWVFSWLRSGLFKGGGRWGRRWGRWGMTPSQNAMWKKKGMGHDKAFAKASLFSLFFLSDDVTTHPSGWKILGQSYRILMWSSEANGDRWWCFELDSCPPWPMMHSWSCCWALAG